MQGTYDDLLERDGAFAEFIRTYLSEEQSDDVDDEGWSSSYVPT